MRIFKQFVYGLFYLAVFGAILYGFYSAFFKTPPGCLNGVRDSGEEGIDCGNVCGKPCLSSNAKGIEVIGQTMVFHPAASSISLMAQIQNSNSEFAARNFSYKFTLYDDQKNILREIFGDSFIYASEIKYIAEFNLQFPDVDKIAYVDFSINDPRWAESSSFSQPRLSLQNFNVSSSDSGVYAGGNFINNGNVPLNKVSILAVFYSNFGPAAGISKSEIENIPAGQQQSFSVIHPPLANLDFQKTRIYLYGASQ